MRKKKSEAEKAYWNNAVEAVFAHPEKTIVEVAQEWHLDSIRLNNYIWNHYKERWNKFKVEQGIVRRGRKSPIADRYEEAAKYIEKHPGEMLVSVAYRFNIYSGTQMAKYINRHHPELLPWRKEWRKEQKRKKNPTRNAIMDEAKLAEEREKQKARNLAYRERQREWRLKELDAPVIPFAERIEAMQKRLNDIRNGRGDTVMPGDLPLLKTTQDGYNMTDFKRKQHTLNLIKRRMEEVRWLKGRY
jgi:hypothetical protein